LQRCAIRHASKINKAKILPKYDTILNNNRNVDPASDYADPARQISTAPQRDVSPDRDPSAAGNFCATILQQSKLRCSDCCCGYPSQREHRSQKALAAANYYVSMSR
jgi:hypothetical protein